MPGHRPSLVNTSLWQIPQACTLIRTFPGLGWGISRSTSSKEPFGRGIWTTRIFATLPPFQARSRKKFSEYGSSLAKARSRHEAMLRNKSFGLGEFPQPRQKLIGSGPFGYYSVRKVDKSL